MKRHGATRGKGSSHFREGFVQPAASVPGTIVGQLSGMSAVGPRSIKVAPDCVTHDAGRRVERCGETAV